MQIPLGESHAGETVESIAYAVLYWLENTEAFAPQQTMKDVVPFTLEHTEETETQTSAVLPLAAALEGGGEGSQGEAQAAGSQGEAAAEQGRRLVAVVPPNEVAGVAVRRLSERRGG